MKLVKHYKLMDILIKYGNTEYGDVIVDEISELFGYPNTNEVFEDEDEINELFEDADELKNFDKNFVKCEDCGCYLLNQNKLNLDFFYVNSSNCPNCKEAIEK